MTNLRELARGQDCTIRLPGCPNATETTVLAHARLSGTCGTGQKPPDTNGAWADEYCHSRVDGRVKCDIHRDELMLYFYEGVLRTLYKLSKLGYRMKK